MVTVPVSDLWKISARGWAFFLIACFALVAIFYDGLEYMINFWNGKEEYSHGYLIPVISVFLIWQKSDQLRKVCFLGSWWGVSIVIFGLLLFSVGELSTLFIIVQYAFVIVLVGLVLSYTGWIGIKKIWFPLLFLVFMIPLPVFLYNNLSLQLQLISSKLGVDFIRFCDITVFLEGNVIDLGSYQLQVVEACSGLRYLFPFMSLAFLSAYLFKGALWKRVVIFLSSAPISVLMNSLRIGTIGVLVEYWGISAAEGFVHDFQGWAVFMVCMTLLVFEMHILARVGGTKVTFSEAFNIEFPMPVPSDAKLKERAIPFPAWTALSIIVLVALLASVYEMPAEQIPPRKSFVQFPMKLGKWQGKPDFLDGKAQEVLALDDYLLANYRDGRGNKVNVYVAYYLSQSKGHSIHSPRSCLPGGGWNVTYLPEATLQDRRGNNIQVARAMIEKGDYKQLVYFWTQQRGRIITNEFLVKWYLFWDGLTKHRSDGALVRFVTPIGVLEKLEQADERLVSMIDQTVSMLPQYVPD